MITEIIACLDGSPFAEEILPLAHWVAATKPVPLTLLRVVGDREEFYGEESYLKDLARAYAARVIMLVSGDPSSAIITELGKHPGAMPVMTTHGRGAWTEAIMGSVALEAVRGAQRPALLYHPRPSASSLPRNIATVIVALDGGHFAEAILPAAVALAQQLGSKLLLLQVLPAEVFAAGNVPARDVVESAYLRSTAVRLQQRHGIAPSWDVLHGEPGDALCRYVQDMPNAMLAMTTHGRSGVRRAILGSIAAMCVRHARLPMLLYSPLDAGSGGDLVGHEPLPPIL